MVSRDAPRFGNELLLHYLGDGGLYHLIYAVTAKAISRSMGIMSVD